MNSDVNNVTNVNLQSMLYPTLILLFLASFIPSTGFYVLTPEKGEKTYITIFIFETKTLIY
jgi:hypothetical protein